MGSEKKGTSLIYEKLFGFTPLPQKQAMMRWDIPRWPGKRKKQKLLCEICHYPDGAISD